MSVRNQKSACPDKEPALQALLFGELEGKEKEAIEHHLEVCSRCRRSLEDARRGLAAVSALKEAPLPFSAQDMASEEPTHTEVAWVDFQRRLRVRREEDERRAVTVSGTWWLGRVAAAAALLILGFGLGRWGIAPRETAPSSAPIESASLEELTVEAQSVEALARAEILADVGLRYVSDLQQVLQGFEQMSDGSVQPVDLTSTREQALNLIRDGRLLRRSLDPSRDGAFITTITRAEIFLEELATVEDDPTGRNVRIVQASLRESRLPDQIAALDVQGKVDLALQLAGWIGEELLQRKEF